MQEAAPEVITMHLPHSPLQARNLIESHNVDATFTQLSADSVEIESDKKLLRMVIREDINGSHVSIISI